MSQNPAIARMNMLVPSLRNGWVTRKYETPEEFAHRAAEKDAHLISAANEMMEAMKQAKTLLSAYSYHKVGVIAAMNQIDAAIAKATGKA